MSSEWPKNQLSQIADVFTGFAFKSEKYLPPGLGVRVVRGDNVTERSIRWGEKEKCWPSVDEELRPYLLQTGDVVIGMDGSKVGKNFAAILPIDNGTLLAQRVARVRAKLGVNQDFVRYLICNQQFTDYVQAVHTGTSIPHISKSQILSFEVFIPPLQDQNWIASLLKTLDDRITLIRQTNASLEAISQALFKSWFVDFDPVRAKQQGQMPEGIDEATAALFPDSFEVSELGTVPKGWKIFTLADAYQLNPTRKLKKGEFAPYLDMASVSTSGHTVSSVISREFGSGTKFINGDTLLARITPCLENGKTAYVDFLADDQTGWGSTEFVVLRPKLPLPTYHGYLLSRHVAFREYAIQSMSGTSGRQRIQNDVLGRFPIAVPCTEIATVFGDISEGIQKKIAANHEQALSLASLRDALLPRLISGQLRITEVKDAVEEIAA
ncbi:type I restriction enzyme S subunit [Oxalobacteraceae bacterium GrIS 2.11]